MARLLGGTARIPTTGLPDHHRRRDARPARRPGPAVQLLRLRGRRPAQRGDLDRPVPAAGQEPAAGARRLHDHRPPEVRRATASCISPQPLRNISDLQHMLPTVRLRPQDARSRGSATSRPPKFGVGRGQLPGLTRRRSSRCSPTGSPTPISKATAKHLQAAASLVGTGQGRHPRQADRHQRRTKTTTTTDHATVRRRPINPGQRLAQQPTSPP